MSKDPLKKKRRYGIICHLPAEAASAQDKEYSHIAKSARPCAKFPQKRVLPYSGPGAVPPVKEISVNDRFTTRKKPSPQFLPLVSQASSLLISAFAPYASVNTLIDRTKDAGPSSIASC